MIIRQPEEELLKVEIGDGLFSLDLSRDMYDTVGAFHELIKNGHDSGSRKASYTDESGYEINVEIFLLTNPGGRKTLVFLDNGEGLTDASLSRFCRIGRMTGDLKVSFGIYDQKRTGRLAALSLLKKVGNGFSVLSATNSQGMVRHIHVDPKSLSEGNLHSKWIPRDDSNMLGLRPSGTFTMLVLSDVSTSAEKLEKIAKDLRWFLPRRQTATPFHLFMNEKEVVPPSLPDELIVTDEAVVGHFRKVDFDSSEGNSKTDRGIWLCDATTNTRVVYCPDIASRVPFPLGRSEICGDLFVPGLIGNQNASRTGFSPVFLNSAEWRRIFERIYKNFFQPLKELLGDEGILKNDTVGKATRAVASEMNRVWGKPTTSISPPSGIDQNPPNPRTPKGDPDDSDGDETGKKKKKKRDYHPRQKAFCYRGTTYFLAQEQNDPEVRAFLSPDGNIVWLNSRNPMLLRHLRQAPTAILVYLLESVIAAIERGNPDHTHDSVACDKAVQNAMLEFFNQRESKG
ncbi:ATP-binding protein [Patescibacteria group bacterium]|nr:ATP-binding protein [Patescibacteria group bacterium]